MKLAYFRKSNHSFEKTVVNLKKESQKSGFEILGETKLADNKGVVFQLCKKEWISNLIALDANLIGFLPCSLVVLNKDNQVMIGAGSPSVLGSISRNPAVMEVSAQAEETIKDLIHKSAGVGQPKPLKVKLYSTTTCPYCKIEQSWLDGKQVDYQVVLVDLNQKEAEAMVEKTGQMGVPVTEIEYEDAESEFVVGFDQAKLSALLNLK